jgi:hypothetical protein
VEAFSRQRLAADQGYLHAVERSGNLKKKRLPLESSIAGDCCYQHAD